MFPIGDDNRGRHITPVVNYLLIVLNIAVFVYQIRLPLGGGRGGEVCSPALAGTIQGFICQYGVVPGEVVRGQDLFTLLTAMFVHGGWGHIFGNMLFLWVFGDNVEDAFGHVGYLLFYLVTGFAASAAQILIEPFSIVPSVGASGAISGVLGAYLIFFGRNAIRVIVFYFITAVPAWLVIGLWAVQQFFATFGSLARTEQTTGGVAYAAHAGGFLAGLLLAALIRTIMGRPEQRPASVQWQARWRA